jgi:hypothetical protein
MTLFMLSSRLLAVDGRKYKAGLSSQIPTINLCRGRVQPCRSSSLGTPSAAPIASHSSGVSRRVPASQSAIIFTGTPDALAREFMPCPRHSLIARTRDTFFPAAASTPAIRSDPEDDLSVDNGSLLNR